MCVKPLDDRPHKQCGNDCADADCHMAQEADRDTERVADNPADSKCGQFVFVGGD